MKKYTDEWLAEQNQKENEKKVYKGREYDTYAALQHQRRLERTIRKQKQDVELRLVKDSSLGGGFVIRTGDMETDWSIKGRMKQLEQILMRR